VTGEHECVKSGGKGQSCALCAKAKQKCVGVVWAGGNAEPSRRSEGVSSGSAEIAGALTEIVKVLRMMRRDMVTGFGEVVDAIDKEYLEEEESDEDSEPELEVTPGELTDLAAESEEGEWYREWLVETGRVVKSDEEVEEKVEEKKDEGNGENGEKGKEVEVAAE
jgi:hypothetical protein